MHIVSVYCVFSSAFSAVSAVLAAVEYHKYHTVGESVAVGIKLASAVLAVAAILDADTHNRNSDTMVIRQAPDNRSGGR